MDRLNTEKLVNQKVGDSVFCTVVRKIFDHVAADDVCNLLASLKIGETINVGYSHFATTVEAAIGHRKFFLSNKGWMGLAPAASARGAIICILLGGASPFMLRTVDDNLYQLVGECYVQGLMDGEAMDDLAKGKFNLQDFTIVF
jgi:hypothetical protein